MPYGWVKTEDESNDEYLDSIPSDDPWRQLILDTHDRLLHLDPDYEITQLKEKFGSLTYYFNSYLAQQIPEIMTAMHAATNAADKASRNLS